MHNLRIITAAIILSLACSQKSTTPRISAPSDEQASGNRDLKESTVTTIQSALEHSKHNILVYINSVSKEKQSEEINLSLNEYKATFPVSNKDSYSKYYWCKNARVKFDFAIPKISYILSNEALLADGDVLEIMCHIYDMYEIVEARVEKSVRPSVLVLVRNGDNHKIVSDDRSKHNLTIFVTVQDGWNIKQDEISIDVNNIVLLSSSDVISRSVSRTLIVPKAAAVRVRSSLLKEPITFSMSKYKRASLDVRIGEFNIGHEYFRAEMNESSQ